MKEQKEKRPISKGQCSFCGGVFGKSGMSRHLESCRKRPAPAEKPPSGGKIRKTSIFHLATSGRWAPQYWMHLEVSGKAKLSDLDDFLRDTWLECCGHLSAFRIEGATFMSEPDLDFGLEYEEDMKVSLSRVLRPGITFLHEYDFGTTTELTIKVLSERVDYPRSDPIQVLARNLPPFIPCDSCGEAATQVCSYCVYGGEGWLCDRCAPKHPCGEEAFLPVVNSPRVGMCGYTGRDTDW